MTKGVIWRFKQSNGLDYAEDFTAYEADVALLMARRWSASDRHGRTVPGLGR